MSNDILIVIALLALTCGYLVLAVLKLQRQVQEANQRTMKLALATKELGESMHAVASSSQSYLAAVQLAYGDRLGAERPPTTH